MKLLLTAEKIRELESSWIKTFGSNLSLSLMEKAGSALAEIILRFEEPYLIICGKGNNGGDGLVALRHLLAKDKKVFLFLTSEEDQLSSDARTNFNLIKDKIKYFKLKTGNEKEFLNALENSNAIVDCILGTGASKELSSFFKNIINNINSSKKKIIACDVPTGVNSTTGTVNESVIKANVTVTFGYTKIGLVIYPAKKYVGKLDTIDIGLPETETNYFMLDDEFLKENFPKREPDSNKGDFGRTLLVSGNKKYPGAALLCSKAAASIGSGITSLASPSDTAIRISPVIPEVTHVDFDIDSILEESKKSSVLVIGPGLTTSDDVKSLVENLILKAEIPIVLDADGINVIAGNKEIIKKSRSEIVLTPHPKEFARLLGVEKEEVMENKIELAKNTAKELNSTIVLKGPATIIATKEGNLYISPFANAALAKGGTGDVLAGFIGGLIAQGLKPSLAASVGVYIHGKIGELISMDKTVFSLLPQDLILYLPRAIKGIG